MGIIILFSLFFSPMLIFSKLGRDDGERNLQTPLKAYMRQGKAGSSAQALIWNDGENSWDLAYNVELSLILLFVFVCLLLY